MLLHVVLLCFAIQSLQMHRVVVAASRLLGATVACVSVSFLCHGDISPLASHTGNGAVRTLPVKLGA